MRERRRGLSTDELARVLDVSPSTVRSRVDDGTLRARRLPAPPGRKRRGNLVFDWEDVVTLAEQMGIEPRHPDDPGGG